MGKRRVIYFYDEQIGNFHYGPSHPMKPHRIRMTHDLLSCYGLLDCMHVKRPVKPSVEMLTQFHTDDYVDFLHHYDVSRKQQELLSAGFGGVEAADLSIPVSSENAAAASPLPPHASSSPGRPFGTATLALLGAAAPATSASTCSRAAAAPGRRLLYSPLLSYSSPLASSAPGAAAAAAAGAAAAAVGTAGAAPGAAAGPTPPSFLPSSCAFPVCPPPLRTPAVYPWCRARSATSSSAAAEVADSEGSTAEAAAGPWAKRRRGHAESGVRASVPSNSSTACFTPSRREVRGNSETAADGGQQKQEPQRRRHQQQQCSCWDSGDGCCPGCGGGPGGALSGCGRQHVGCAVAAATPAAAAVSGGGGIERRERAGELRLPPLGRVELSSSLPDLHAKFNIGEDCPVFDGLWDYCGIYTGGSIEGARRVATGEFDFAINWAGGLHHAKKHEASGFCYVNDCVLAALELLRVKHRVLYIDVDIHHGDGVEEAFYTSPRVMCCSFHKYGDYFPGTGAVDDIGADAGLGYSVNVPLHEGISDSMYIRLFRCVMDRILEVYRPEAVVLQSGADSLAGDRLGCFNLSVVGHSEAAKYFREKGLPTVFLGGGGYTLRNVPRCWAVESACVLGVELSPDIPEESEYLGYYGPDHKLDVRTANMENRNDEEYIHSLIENVFETLKDYVFPVCAQISAAHPSEWHADFEEQLLAAAAAEEEEKESCMDETLDCDDVEETEHFIQKSDRNRG